MGNRNAFLALLKAGLWNTEVPFSHDDTLDFTEILRFADEQSVIGIVTAGAEKLPAGKLPLTEKLTLLGKCQLIELRNVAMNQFIGELVRNSQEKGIKTLLVKGQGVAQCNERPLWRSSGDVDLLFERKDYRKATELFMQLASSHKRDERYSSHLGLTIDSWYVEIHGTMRSGLSARVDKMIDEVQKDTFENNKFRVWRNGGVDVHLPDPNNDVFFVFVHFLMHFYRETMCLRQLCDWCRLLWTFQKEIDRPLLEARLKKAGLVKEWKAFAALSVDYLGMPIEAMPLYDDAAHWRNKGEKVLNHILKNRKHDKLKDTIFFARLFPWNTLCFSPSIFLNVNRLKIKEIINDETSISSRWREWHRSFHCRRIS